MIIGKADDVNRYILHSSTTVDALCIILKNLTVSNRDKNNMTVLQGISFQIFIMIMIEDNDT